MGNAKKKKKAKPVSDEESEGERSSKVTDESQVQDDGEELPQKSQKKKEKKKKFKAKGPARWDEVNIENDRRVILILINLFSTSMSVKTLRQGKLPLFLCLIKSQLNRVEQPLQLRQETMPSLRS